MNLWISLGRILPWNRENKWPLWAQLMAFALFELLFIWAVEAATALVYLGPVMRWADRTFGASSGMALNLLCGLLGAELCAWRMGLHRVVPFGANQPRRWTVLPVALWYLAFQACAVLLSYGFSLMALPLWTVNPFLGPVVHCGLYLLSLIAMAAMVAAFREKRLSRACALLLAQILLITGLSLMSAMESRAQFQQMMQEAQPPIAMVVVPEGAEENEELLAILGKLEGVTPDSVIIVNDPAELYGLSAKPFDDPAELDVLFAHPEEDAAADPAMLFATVLQYLQIIPTFFILKRWIFPHKEEVSYDESAAL